MKRVACSALIALVGGWLCPEISAAAEQYPDPTQPLPIYDESSTGGWGNFNTGWKGFPACWKHRQAAFAKVAAGEQGALVFFGDSLTQLCPLEKLFPGMEVANRGIAGDTSRGMLCRLSHDVLALKPSGVVFLAGANDVDQPGFDAEGSVKNVQAILEGIHKAYPDIKIAVLKTTPQAKVEQHTKIKELNALLEKGLAGLDYVILVESYVPYVDQDGGIISELFRDGVHLNAKGYAVYQAFMKPVLEKLK